jgi:hypothetical protein
MWMKKSVTDEHQYSGYSGAPNCGYEVKIPTLSPVTRQGQGTPISE